MSGYYVRGGNSDWILSLRARSGARRGVKRIMGVKRRKPDDASCEPICPLRRSRLSRAARPRTDEGMSTG